MCTLQKVIHKNQSLFLLPKEVLSSNTISEQCVKLEI